MKNNFTLDDLNKLIKNIEAVSYPPQSDYIFFALQTWVDEMPEYFYKDESGQWWFETPFTCKVKTQIIPQKFQCDYGILIPEEEIYPIHLDVEKVIYSTFEKLGEKNEL